jgi:Flp pilus assembly protein TadD
VGSRTRPGATDQSGVHTDLLLDQAGDLLHQGRAGKAATLLGPVVGQEPGNLGAWQLLARARLDLGEPEPALEAARTALRLDPGGTDSLCLVSAAYSALGRHDLAIAAATAACADDPGNPRLAGRRGRALLAAGRIAEAELSLRSAAEFAYYDADLHVVHGIALFAAGRPLSAREAYGHALRIDPGHDRARTELRRLGTAERVIIDADSLVRITDAFAESLRIPAGGRPHHGRGTVFGHLARTTLIVCLLALVALGIVGVTTDLTVPLALTMTLFCAAGSAACVTALTARSR